MLSPLPAKVAVVGCGTVGASWAALFIAHGCDVCAYDPAPGAADRLHSFVDKALGQLRQLGCDGQGALSYHTDLASALSGCDFVQENTPEHADRKRDLLAELDGLAAPDAIIASSTSSLLRSAIVAGCEHRRRHIVAHPFNPPHLIPLVEIVGEDADVVARGKAFYTALGRHPIVLRKEMAGHIANRLSSALYQEAVHLVEQGVASVADIDAAVCHGPGLRWALIGPHMTYHLGGGPGGIDHYLTHLGPSQVRRWAALGQPSLDAKVRELIVQGIEEEAAGRSIPALESERDELLLGLLRLLARRPDVSAASNLPT